MSADEQRRVRVAFAEGYLAGQSIKSIEPSKSNRWMKIFQQFVFNMLFIAVLVMLMGMLISLMHFFLVVLGFLKFSLFYLNI